jgi:hypothetical protein
MPRQALKWSPVGSQRRGRPRQIWNEDGTDMLREQRLLVQDAEYKGRWKVSA